MSLYKGKVQSIFTGSYILPGADNKRRINVSREKVRTKKLSIKKHIAPPLGLGGLSHKKKRAELPEGQNMSENIKRHSIWDMYVYSFEPIPKKNSAIASGATPIRSAVARPIERSRQKKDEKLQRKTYWWTSDISIIVYISSTTNFDYIVDKINIDYSHRELFMRAKTKLYTPW
jgi:hypothetical protein